MKLKTRYAAESVPQKLRFETVYFTYNYAISYQCAG